MRADHSHKQSVPATMWAMEWQRRYVRHRQLPTLNWQIQFDDWMLRARYVAKMPGFIAIVDIGTGHGLQKSLCLS